MKTQRRAIIALALTAVISPTSSLAGQMSDKKGTRPAAQSAQEGPEAAMARFPLVYVVRYRPGAAYQSDRPLLRQNLREHEGYMRRQTQAGVIIAAGPTFEEAGGLVLIHASSRQDAEAFIQADPAVVAGIFVGEATDWRPVFDPKSIFRQTPPAK